MFNFYLKSSHYTIKTLINQFKYYAQKLPIIRKMWKNSSFELGGLKGFFQALGPLATIILKFFTSLISLLFSLIPILIIHGVINEFVQVELSQTFTLIIGYLSIFGLYHFVIKNNAEKALVYYDLFNIPAKTIIQADIYFDEIVSALAIFLALFMIGKILAMPNMVIIMISFLNYCNAIISNAFNLWIFEKKWFRKKFLNVQNLLSIFLLFVMLGITYAFRLEAKDIIMSPITVLVMLGLMILSFVYIRNYDYFTQVLIDLSRDYEPETYQSAKENHLKNISELKESDQIQSVKYLTQNLSGYELLNELFFQRHRRLLLKPIKIKAIIFAFVLITITVIPLLPIEVIQKELSNHHLIEEIVSVLPGYLPFAAYFLFYNESFTRVMFMNCDESLLQYHFYSRSKDLLDMFKLRLNKIAQWNGISMALFLSWLIAIKVLYNVSLLPIMILGLQMASLWIFFSVHTLFVYYIFQPFNDKYEAKHPIYHILNTAVYIICYFTMNMHPEGIWVAPIFITISILYIVFALIMVYRKAPQTFKIRIRK